MPPRLRARYRGAVVTQLGCAGSGAAEDAKFGFLRSADLRRVAILAHAAGVSVAVHMLSGEGRSVHLCCRADLA